MYVKLGTQFCPDCNVPVTPQSFEAIVAQVQRELRGASVEVLAPLVINSQGPVPDLAKWARGRATRSCASMANTRPPINGRAWTATRNTTSSCPPAWWWCSRR